METATGVLYGAVLFVRGYGKPAAEPMAMEKGKKAIFMKQVFTNGRKQELSSGYEQAISGRSTEL